MTSCCSSRRMSCRCCWYRWIRMLHRMVMCGQSDKLVLVLLLLLLVLMLLMMMMRMMLVVYVCRLLIVSSSYCRSYYWRRPRLQTLRMHRLMMGRWRRMLMYYISINVSFHTAVAVVVRRQEAAVHHSHITFMD